MPKVPLVSGKVVLANVIRALGYKLPSSSIDDVLEFIGEGLEELQITNSLITTSTGDIDCPDEILIRNHCAQLPCGLVQIVAVEDENGRRLPLGSDQTDIKSQTSIRHSYLDSTRPNTFNVDPYVHQTSDGLPEDEAPEASVPYFGEDVTAEEQTVRKNHYYNIQGNYIQTSFECGYVKIHYLSIPVDSDGFPLVPDNANYKRALEWHVIRRLIGAGYKHPVFSYKEADTEFKYYAALGMGEVSYYNPEGAARLNRSHVRLIPNYAAYSNFFSSNEQDEILRK